MVGSEVVFIVSFLLLSILEGIGQERSHTAVLLLYGSLPWLLFYVDSWKKKEWFFPRKLSILAVLFFFSCAVSTLLSVNMQNSVERLVFYLSTFLLCVFVWNHQRGLQKPFMVILVVLGSLLASLSFVSYLLLSFGITTLVPAVSLNFIFSTYPSHNPLGDFLLVPFFFCLYSFVQNKSKKLLFLSFIFLVFIAVSFSRSAYLALMFVVAVFMLKKEIRKSRGTILILTSFLIIAAFFFLSTVNEIARVPFFSQARITFIRTFHLSPYKSFFAERARYFIEPYNAFLERPLTGYGPGNFHNASQKYTNFPYHGSQNSHNFLLDMFAEVGGVGGLLFVAMIFYLFLKKKKDVYFYASFALFLNFLTFDLYGGYSTFLLFFILLVVGYEEKKAIQLKRVHLISFLLLVFMCFITTSLIFVMNKQYKEAIIFYPLNEAGYNKLFEQFVSRRNFKAAEKLIPIYAFLFRGESTVLNQIGNMYLISRDKKNALLFFKRAYDRHRYEGLDLFEKIYKLEVELHGSKEAMKFISEYFEKVSTIHNSDFSTQLVIRESRSFCTEVYIICPYQLY